MQKTFPSSESHVEMLSRDGINAHVYEASALRTKIPVGLDGTCTVCVCV